VRRRTFLTTLPLAAASLSQPTFAGVSGESNALHEEKVEAPKPYQAPGEERFQRPDVHAGDRPAGASFTTRSPALGCSGAAGYGASAGNTSSDRDAKARRLCHRRSRSSKRLPGIDGAGKLRSRRRLLRSHMGPQTIEGRRHGQLRQISSLTVVGDSTRTCEEWSTAKARCRNRLDPRRTRWLVDDAPALRKAKVGELFEPAIHYCETGSPVPQIIGWYIKRNLAVFTRPGGSGVEETANAVHTYAPGGKAPNEYDVFRNPDLARTYRMIAEGGRDAFYDGPIAKTIDAYFKRIGGWLSREDLHDHHAEWVDPLVTNYRGVDVYAMGANTQGLATLQMLNIIEQFDVKQMGFQSAASLHIQTEAKRLAYEDRARYYADPHLCQDPSRLAQLKGLCQRASQAHQDGSDPAAYLSRSGAESRRHDLLLHCRQRRHDGLDDPVQLQRYGFRARRRWSRIHVSGSR